MAGAEQGLAALTAGLEASGRWLLANRAFAQLMFWRSVPGFEPPGSARPSAEVVALQRTALAAAGDGQLGHEADSDEAVCLISTLITGVLSQAIANEPGLTWGQGRFTPLLRKSMSPLPAAYPVAPANRLA